MLSNLKEVTLTFIKWIFNLKFSLVELGIIWFIYKWWV